MTYVVSNPNVWSNWSNLRDEVKLHTINLVVQWVRGPLGLHEAETAYSGDAGTLGQDSDGSGMSGFDSTGGRVVDAVGRPMSTEKAEGLGRDTGDFQEMGFTIEKTGLLLQSHVH